MPFTPAAPSGSGSPSGAIRQRAGSARMICRPAACGLPSISVSETSRRQPVRSFSLIPEHSAGQIIEDRRRQHLRPAPPPLPPWSGPSGGLPPLRGAAPGSVLQKFWKKIFYGLTTITHRKYKRFLTQCYIFVCILYTVPWSAFSHLRINGLTRREDLPGIRREDFLFFALAESAAALELFFFRLVPWSVKRHHGASGPIIAQSMRYYMHCLHCLHI